MRRWRRYQLPQGRQLLAPGTEIFKKDFFFSIEQRLAPRSKRYDYIEHCHHHHLLLVIALIWDIWNIMSWGCWYLPQGPGSAPCRPGLSVRTMPGQTFSPSEELLMIMMMIIKMMMMMIMWRQTVRMRKKQVIDENHIYRSRLRQYLSRVSPAKGRYSWHTWKIRVREMHF